MAFAVTDISLDVRSEVDSTCTGDICFTTSLPTKWHIDCHVSFKNGVLLSRVSKGALSFQLLCAHFGAKIKCFYLILIEDEVTENHRSQEWVLWVALPW